MWGGRQVSEGALIKEVISGNILDEDKVSLYRYGQDMEND